MMIKVANIIEEGRYSGPQVRVIAVAQRLKEMDVETLVICSRYGSDRFAAEAAKRNIHLLPLEIKRLSRRPAAIVEYLLTFGREVFVIRGILIRENVHIVHCNSARQFKGVVAAWLSRKKVIWHLQDTWSPRIVKILFKIFSLMTDYFIVAGYKVAEYYVNGFAKNRKPLKYIQAPVDTSFFDDQLGEPDRIIQCSSGVKVVTVGNINPAKGFEYFIEAARLLVTQGCECSFWIVGPPLDSQKEYYKKLVNKVQRLNLCNVNFYGPSTDVRSILKSADIYVCASIHEASPISVWEAMSMSKGIVSTDVGDVGRFIQDGVNGFVVPAGDVVSLAHRIEILFRNPALREEFGRNARVVACRELDVKITVLKHLQAYQECLEQ